ncbi:MAG TPA: AMP-binding protein [Myxococcota bacterium]|nr:AMP-binding protein [Myxococcota bacterium]
MPKLDAAFHVGAQLDARAAHPEIAERIAIRSGDLVWTYRAFRDESVRVAHLLLRRLGRRDDAHPAHVAMLMENRPDLLALYAGCAYTGSTLFGVNTGLRGDTLAGVLNQSRARVLVVDETLWPEIERLRGKLQHLAPENVLVVRTRSALSLGDHDYHECLTREVAKPGTSLDTPSVDVRPENNLMVIYTSGTTGLPKGINNNHLKVLIIGRVVSGQLQLGDDAVGYACMPLFHSNAMFLGFHPTFEVGGTLAMRERFSATGYVPDVLRYGVTYWNYVGEPVHYILEAIERQYGGDEERIRREITEDPRNRLRYALGNGASPPDIDRFVRWLGLEDMFELYGSTEAAISTFRRHSDPRGSVGEVNDPAVKILDESGRECAPARVDGDGKLLNYAEAVGEICRVAPDTSLFQGYFDNADANAKKYRDGVYHSGDLGHILVHEGRRLLFFDGRTDDWIRKDGENFSAQQVARLLQEHPDVSLAAAYGVPCPVSDEWVMAALLLREGAAFDPAEFFRFCEDRVANGGMDRKWIPDFVRIVRDFEFTQTQKILVRNLKRLHFDRRRLADEPIFWRRRGDDRFHPFASGDYETLRREFERSERLDLLEH